MGRRYTPPEIGLTCFSSIYSPSLEGRDPDVYRRGTGRFLRKIPGVDRRSNRGNSSEFPFWEVVQKRQLTATRRALRPIQDGLNSASGSVVLRIERANLPRQSPVQNDIDSGLMAGMSALMDPGSHLEADRL